MPLYFWQGQKDLNPRHAVLEWMRKQRTGSEGGQVSPSSSRKSQNGWCWFGAAGKFSGPKRAKSNQAQYNKKSAGVMIAGCVRPDSRKSLSPVRSTSALARMAARTSLGIVICPLAMTLALSTVSPVVEAPCKNRHIPCKMADYLLS